MRLGHAVIDAVGVLIGEKGPWMKDDFTGSFDFGFGEVAMMIVHTRSSNGSEFTGEIGRH